MASAYLMQKEAEYKVQAQQEKNQVSASIQNQIYQLQNAHKRPETLSDFLPFGCIGAVLVVFVLGSMISADGGFIIAAGLILIAVITFMLYRSKLSKTNDHNDQLDRQAEALRRQEADQYRAIDEKYARMLERETARFNASVKASRAKYGGHTAAQPIVRWLDVRFEKEIMGADRRSHNKNIEVVFAFRVDADQLVTLKKVSNTNQYGNAEIFNFNINRFHDLPDFEDRVGFSQAIAKLVQFDMMSRFPKDPIAPSHAKPLVIITSNDSMMELCYRVANPNYRHAVTL